MRSRQRKVKPVARKKTIQRARRAPKAKKIIYTGGKVLR